MSAPELHHARAASRSVSTTSSASTLTAQPSPRTVSGLERDIVDAADTSRVLECSQVERQLGFQRLVCHYLSQILHGCKSAYCTTPTCLSCQKRNAPRPVRPPTQLTARALAHYLARHDDPRRGLCPHELRVEPDSLQIDRAVGARLHQARDGTRQFSLYQSALGVADAQHTSASRVDALHQAGTVTLQDSPRAQQHVVDAVKSRQQTRKDRKSLSQNLYDSVSMIYAYSKQLPSSTSLFQSLQSSSSPPQNDAALSSLPDAKWPTFAESSSHVTSAPFANGFPVTPPVNMPASPDRQHPQSNGHVRAPSASSPILSDGQQVHRIPYHVRGSPKPGKSSKVTQTSIDGTIDPPRLSIAKTRKKSHSPERDVPGMGRTTSPSFVPKGAGRGSPPVIRAPIAIPVLSTLSCSSLEALKDDVYGHRKDQLPDNFNFSVDYDANRHFQHSTPFANRSLFYTLSDPETLLKSFRDPSKAFEKSPLSHLDSARLTHSFRDWNRHNGALVFDSLWIALKALFTPPPELTVQKSPRLVPSRKGASANNPTDRDSQDAPSASRKQRYLDNAEAAHIVMICIHALTSSVSVGWPHTWAQLRKLRAWGIILPDAAPNNDDYIHPYLTIIDDLEYEPAIRLAEHLLRAIGARTCFERILSTTKKQTENREDDDSTASLMEIVVQHLEIVERVALATKRRMTPNGGQSDDPGWTVSSVLLEWLKTLITKRWDSKLAINKWTSVGSAVLLLDKLYHSRPSLRLRPEMFEIPFFNERFDAVEEPVKFLDWEEQPNTLHILQYPALFPEEYLVRYFRTINFTSMMEQYNQTIRTRQMRGLLQMFLRDPHNWLIKNKMKVTLSDYLFLNVSREKPLKDTLDQLWGLEKRMLLKPLKVQMGAEEGELGQDHGGVTYEFFRVVLSEAFKPDHGMFTLDPQTRMTWFQPGTLEPVWKFEMLGMIFSLAVYNGITLPVTFPHAFYQFLLHGVAPLRATNLHNIRDCLDLVADGWPELAKSFGQLLSFEGDVADIFMREYVFSYDVFGHRVDHDMDEPYTQPGSPPLTSTPKEPKMVTNKNRAQFIWDYLNHLTYLSVQPQLHAFKQGFYACLNTKAIALFTPYTLRHLVEGEQHISIPALRRCARYEDGYSATHPTIITFWRIVEQYSQDDCRKLLEFVTASDRVPVTGYEGITFHIKRVGDGDMLPTSSTCFGRLYLPEYETEEKMGSKLLLAIQNSKGFGVV
ncbi:hypothetical protein HBH70_045480 [Parastagonospora nodorum]|nr:hypothetical protein HBH53_178050 [Parastagonospora nodorum]KAH3959227.1 hypothetical protein HBH51_200410 [Parastagonospora nodorum]KAH4066460.1 hypothetical protein HBH50_149480 [Parastagonospora nodorum]KAH4089541.1 hypothetical protein HBH48_114580 [Parastagonospora nodorum]KAH4108960.1 hypothetical protein HBH46_038500 [Parastagonospora nodorum]